MSMGSQKQQAVMEWTDEHDVILLREIIGSELFSYKKGSPDRGRIWETIQEMLNKIENPKFRIKDKRGIRDRWTLLQTKFKKRMLKEEAASGINAEMTEIDVLIEELCEKEKSLSINSDKKKAMSEAADDVRKKAMERLTETKKRKSDTEKAEGAKEKKSRRSSGEVVEFLKEKTKSEHALRLEEIEIKKKEQENSAKQQDRILELMRRQTDQMQSTQAQMAQQQLQMSQALMVVLQKLADK